MKFRKKYKIVTGITTEYKINPENPKYFAKFKNDTISCYAHTELAAIARLEELYEEYKIKNKLHGPLSNKVLNTFVSTEKPEKYFHTVMDFFELVGVESYTQIDDEMTVEDFELSEEEIKIVNSEYGINVKPSDVLVTIFEKISKNSK